jgi:hypothetical protein
MSQMDNTLDGKVAQSRSKRTFLFGLIILMCLGGGILLFWPYEDDRSLWWLRCHLEILDSQLQGLKELLQDFKEKHGRYPTNDEGLAALDNFESRFAITYYREFEDLVNPEATGFSGDIFLHHFWWGRSGQALQEYRDQHGRAPSNQQELFETSFCRDFSIMEATQKTIGNRYEPKLPSIAITTFFCSTALAYSPLGCFHTSTRIAAVKMPEPFTSLLPVLVERAVPSKSTKISTSSLVADICMQGNITPFGGSATGSR